MEVFSLPSFNSSLSLKSFQNKCQAAANM